MAKRSKQRLTITLDSEVLHLVDGFIDGKRIRNRSHAIEYLIGQQLKPRVRQAVILASGNGVKMRPFTYELPKSMLPVKGRPLLEHSIVMLREANVREIVIVVSHLAEKIQEHFGDGSKFGVHIRYVRETKPSGTATPLRKAGKLLREEPFLLLYGDVLADIDLLDLFALYDDVDALAVMALKTTDDPKEYGVVTLKGNRIVEFEEKPKQGDATSALINAGVMVLSSEVLSEIPSKGSAMLEADVFEKLVSTDRVYGYPFEGAWFDVGTPEEYEEALKSWEV